MKAKLTLLSALMLVASFSFGQVEVIKNQKKSSDVHLKKQVKDSDTRSNKNTYAWQLQFAKVNAQMASSSASRVVKQALDSLVYEEYDEFSGQWSFSEKESFTYDFNKKLTLAMQYYWTGTNWEVYSKTEYTNAANATLTESVYFNWTGSNWEPNNKVTYTYNSGNSVVSETEYYWVGSQWEETFKTVYTYNVDGQLVEETSEYFDGMQWVPSSKNEFEYDVYGNITLEIYQGWDGTQWMIYGKYEYLYDSNGNMIESLDYYWNGIQLELSYKAVFTYDANGYLTQEIDSVWNGVQWMPDYKYEITNAVNGNLTQEVAWEWDGSQWVESYKDEFTYNNMYSFNDLVLPFFFLEDGDNAYFNHMLTNVEEFEIDSVSGNWFSYFKISLYYSSLNVNSISNIERESISVYPNPVSDQINVIFSGELNTAQFELYDVQGRLLLSKRVASREQIDLGNFQTGMYFYNLVVGDETHTGKLIKE